MVARRGHPTRGCISTSPAFHLGSALIDTYVEKDLYDPYEHTAEDGEEWDTVIGNDVWIGTRTMLIGGIHVGDGAIIGAGSIVTKDVPPYAVVAGNPARIIRYRFDEDKIQKLEKIKWWERDEAWVIENTGLFWDVDEFINKTTRANGN